MTTIKVTLSERRPVTIDTEEWPVIARADDHDGQVKCQANNEWKVIVREHADGRRLVYSIHEAGNGGQHIRFREVRGGFLVDSSDKSRPGVGTGCEPNDDETVRAIRRVAGLIGRDDLGADCIGDLPGEQL